MDSTCGDLGESELDCGAPKRNECADFPENANRLAGPKKEFDRARRISGLGKERKKTRKDKWTGIPPRL